MTQPQSAQDALRRIKVIVDHEGIDSPKVDQYRDELEVYGQELIGKEVIQAVRKNPALLDELIERMNDDIVD